MEEDRVKTTERVLLCHITKIHSIAKKTSHRVILISYNLLIEIQEKKFR